LLAVLTLAGCSSRNAEFSGFIVGDRTPTRYLANLEDPGIGMSWIEPSFQDSGWSDGEFGIGGEWAHHGGVKALVNTEVPRGTWSVYTRTTFDIPAVSALENLFFGIDYDDAVVVCGQRHGEPPGSGLQS